MKANRYEPVWLRRTIKITLAMLFSVVLLAGAAAWFFPVDVIVNEAIARAGDEPYAQLEAGGHAEFACWFIRLASPAALLAIGLVWRKIDSTLAFVRNAALGFRSATSFKDDAGRPRFVASSLFRLLCLVWFVLAAGHLGDSFAQRMRDWPYFRFRSGDQVLPNISESNVEVIRYLKRFTPENARILVVSDQKLFFLSYYLLPRRLYHKMHPDSEHVIPKAHLMRRLATYKLADIDEATLNRIKPDYILEYFEHPDEVDPTRLLDDSNWVGFVRALHRNPTHVPKYLVRLTRFNSHTEQASKRQRGTTIATGLAIEKPSASGIEPSDASKDRHSPQKREDAS